MAGGVRSAAIHDSRRKLTPVAKATRPTSSARASAFVDSRTLRGQRGARLNRAGRCADWSAARALPAWSFCARAIARRVRAFSGRIAVSSSLSAAATIDFTAKPRRSVAEQLPRELKKLPRAARGRFFNAKKLPRRSRGRFSGSKKLPRNLRGGFSASKKLPRGLRGGFSASKKPPRALRGRFSAAECGDFGAKKGRSATFALR